MTDPVVLAWTEGSPAAGALGILSPAERARYEGMGSADAAACFLGARALVRTLLSEREPRIAPSEWRFEPVGSGKPVVVGPERGRSIHFNVAHTNGFVVAAVADVAVGVDVEDRRRSARIDKIARRFFSAEEAEWVLALSEDEKRAAFFEVWVMKEAVVKARGDALGDHLASLTFERAEIGVSPTTPLPDYTLRRFECGPFLVALAVEAPERFVQVRPG